MEKMLVVVFDNEKKAYDATRALNQLDSEGSVTVHAETVIAKSNDGTVTVKKEADEFPVRTVTGTAIGSLIGLLGGPIGVGFGAAAGTIAGAMDEIYFAGVDDDFIMDISSHLTNGKYAVLADVSEEWVTPIDTKMEELGGTVFRTAKKNFEADQWAKDTAATNLEIDQLKTEMAKARADRKAKLQSKIDALNKKLETKQMKANERLKQMKGETDAKIHGLEMKRKTAHADMKARIDSRIDEVRKHYEESERQFKMHRAEQLERAGKRLGDKAATLKKEAEVVA
jgi:uncharacterized membrane protein